MAEDKVYDLVIIGAGPAALTAAIYSTRENIDTLLIEKGVIGGLAAITDKVDNYPGFEDGVEGLKLADQMKKQAERFGAVIELDEVTGIEDHHEYKIVKGYGGEYKAKAVLIATGSDYVRLGIPGEDDFYGRGVHFCATCDGAFYQQKRLVVVGGGNSSAQESLFLTRFADKIDVLIRGDAWKASDVLVDEINEHEKITVHFNVESKEIVGKDGKLNSVKAWNNKKKEEVIFETDGVFVFIGLKPNTAFLKDTAILCDQYGFVMTDENLQTEAAGIFCAGDVRSGATMQIASATGEGATAALHIREYLEAKARGKQSI